MAGSDNLEAYMLTYIVLTAIFIKPIFILWCISLCLGRRRGDPARIGFTIMKILFPLVAIALTLLAVAEALNYVEIFVGSYSYRFDSEALYTATIRTGITGTFFERLAGVALLLTQVEIGIGFLYVLTQTREKLQTMVRFGALAMAGLLFILSIASLGKTMSSWNLYFGYRYGSSSDSEYDSFIENLNVSAKLSGAVEILFWLTCLPVLAFAALVMHKVKSYPMLRNSGVLLLITTILNFIRYTWNLAYAATWILPDDANYVPNAVTIVQPLLDVWPLFVLLVLLFVISIRKQKGLWSLHQPWMTTQPTFAPAMQAPQGAWAPAQGGAYAAPPPGYQGQPMQYQQYPQQQQQLGYGALAQPQMQQNMQPQVYPQQPQQPIPREVSPLQPSESTEPSSHELPHDSK